MCYLDECQNFTTDAFAQILSELRKYHVGFVLSGQFLAQQRPSVRAAMVGNIGTLVSFQLGHEDAEELEPVFAPYGLDTLTGLRRARWPYALPATAKRSSRSSAIPTPRQAADMRTAERRFASRAAAAMAAGARVFRRHDRRAAQAGQKFKVGLVLVHQNLEQLSERLRATIMASTSIKFAGGVGARDTATFAKENALRSRVRADHPQARESHRVRLLDQEHHPAGDQDRGAARRGSATCPRLDEHAYGRLIAGNRARYAAPVGEGRGRSHGRPPSAQVKKPDKGGFELGTPNLL